MIIDIGMAGSRWQRMALFASFALLGVVLSTSHGASSTTGTGSGYYKVLPLFHPFPDENKTTQSIDRFGPVGIGIELRKPAFTMFVKNVEKGSPADATGKLNKGQRIDSINGRVLKDMDPRLILGGIIARAEASDGVVRLVVRDKENAPPQMVDVKIPVLGAYSDTWPLDCQKSERIIRALAEYVKRSGVSSMGQANLFLLSTGDESDLAFVRKRMQAMAEKNKNKRRLDTYPWYIGYGGPAICEYYLRTGDDSVLHTIQLYADHLRDTMYNNAWGGKGIGGYGYMAGGHMNAAGVHSLTFLLLAKQCGVKVDEHTLLSSLRHFYRFAGHGNVSYGDGLPERSFVDNGKTGGLAFSMAAAASLTPEGEESVYAKARDISAHKSFYSTSWMLHGHTGGGIGELWRGSAMGFLHDKKQKKYREFMNHRAWFYDLSRRFNGSFGIVGGGRYDDPAGWAVGMGLVYTMPLKTLQLTGAPKTEFCHSYTLPERPWGTKADEAFFSLKPVPVPGKEPQDVDNETLPEGSSLPVLRTLRDPEVTLDTLLKYAYHPELGIREYSLGRIKNRGLQAEAIQMLKSDDPRMRHAGMLALPEMNDEAIELLVGIVEDPEESLWVAMNAMDRLGGIDPELLAPHVPRLTHFLKHDDWWVRKSAMTALTKLSADKRFYKDILPIIGDMIVKNTHAVALHPLYGVINQIKEADPEVQAYAVTVLGSAYSEFPTVIKNPAGNDLPSAVPYLIKDVAYHLSNIPGGFDALFKVSRERNPGVSLPHMDLYMKADSSMFGSGLQKAFKPLVLNYLIPKNMGIDRHPAPNRSYLTEEALSRKPRWANAPHMRSLVGLYNRIGIHDYDWLDIGPKLNDMEFDYFTFDPPEKKLPGSGTRYRKVTLPAGMTNWYMVDFDTKKAGWKTGKQPFGQINGELDTQRGHCKFDFCRHGEPMQTFWDKEVILMSGKFKFPKFREGHRYRLLIGGVSHVNRGEGFRIYINGKLLMEKKSGTPRRGGSQPITTYLQKDWWQEFGDGETTIAATSFLRMDNNSTKNRFFVWLQEMKVPPLTEEMYQRGRTLQPMRCLAWQISKNDTDKFHYSGEFIDNSKVRGEWEFIGRVPSVDAFNPRSIPSVHPKWLYADLSLLDGGETSNYDFFWSDNMLMDLNAKMAMKITPKKIGRDDYLFIEAGGFSKRNRSGWSPDHPVDWVPELCVMKRKE